MTAQFTVAATTAFVECDNECGNYTHPSIGKCGDCLNEQSFITTRGIKDNALARRFLVSGY